VAEEGQVIGENTIDAVVDWMNVSIKAMQKNLDKGGKHGTSNNTGTLRQSLGKNFQKPIKVKGGFLTATIDAVDYWGAVDQGRVPTKNKSGGTPTLSQTLVKWVQTKLPTRGNDLASAYAIAKKIHEKGTEGTQFVEKVLTKKHKAKLGETVTENLRLDTIIAMNAAIKG
jgi:hypothetical protein